MESEERKPWGKKDPATTNSISWEKAVQVLSGLRPQLVILFQRKQQITKT